MKYIKRKLAIKVDKTSGSIVDTINIDDKITNTYSARLIDKVMGYSTEEQMIGTWINGKPLYRRTYNFGALPSTTVEKSIDTGLYNDKIKIINARGFSINNTNSATVIIPRSHPTDLSNGIALNLWTSEKQYKIGIVCGIDRSIYTETYITVEYIKLTD